MKKIVYIIMILVSVSIGANAQFWINFNWNSSVCDYCDDMAEYLDLTLRQAREYDNIIHYYGQRIQRETRMHTSNWDICASRIYNLRMERDMKLQSILSPEQFKRYIELSRQDPRLIHDWIGWYNNPSYPNYRPSRDIMRFEDRYWHNSWVYRNNRWQSHFDNQGWYPGKFDKKQPASAGNHGVNRPQAGNQPKPSINNNKPQGGNKPNPSYNNGANQGNQSKPSYNGGNNHNNQPKPSYNNGGNQGNQSKPSYNGGGQSSKPSNNYRPNDRNVNDRSSLKSGVNRQNSGNGNRTATKSNNIEQKKESKGSGSTTVSRSRRRTTDE